MRKASLCTSIVAASLLLAGCGSDVQHGTIRSKQYIPQTTRTDYQPVYGNHCNSKGYCTTYVITYMPYQVTDPECYQFTLIDDKKNVGNVCVDHDSYNKMKPGDKW